LVNNYILAFQLFR